MIQAIMVDLGGVAARFLPERRLQMLAAKSRIEPAVLQKRLFESGLESRYSPEQVMAMVSAALQHRVETATIVEAWAQAFEPQQETLEMVRTLQIPLVLFTNNGPMIDACFAGPLHDLASFFGEIICSWHIHARKPEPAAFERAAGRVGLLPENLLLLDDGAGNVEAARSCGWAAELVADYQDLAAAVKEHVRH